MLEAPVTRARSSSPLSDMVARFDNQANRHKEKQAANPFSNGAVGSMPRPKFSKEEYGRPARGSLSETRGYKATIQICKEMLELCEIIAKHGEPLFEPHEKQNDPRVVIAFGELFNIYTYVSDKLVGMLLRARKHKLLDFEGECLFQRRDDHVPIILLKPIQEIRSIFEQKIDTALAAIKEQEQEQLSLASPYDSDCCSRERSQEPEKPLANGSSEPAEIIVNEIKPSELYDMQQTEKIEPQETRVQPDIILPVINVAEIEQEDEMEDVPQVNGNVEETTTSTPKVVNIKIEIEQ